MVNLRFSNLNGRILIIKRRESLVNREQISGHTNVLLCLWKHRPDNVSTFLIVRNFDESKSVSRELYQLGLSCTEWKTASQTGSRNDVG